MSSNKENEANPRKLAALDLKEWFQTNQLKYRKRNTFSQPRDYALYSYLLHTVVRNKRKYSFIISSLSNIPWEKLDVEPIICLMICLAQFDSEKPIAQHAIVNEGVELTASLGKPHLKGFVNANIKKYIREKDELTELLEKQKIGITTSYPEWLVKRWKKFYGLEQMKKICQAGNIPAQVQIVPNPKIGAEQIKNELEKSGYTADKIEPALPGFQIKNAEGLFATELAKKGNFLVQDASSQTLIKLLEDVPKSKVIDLCAAPGGKSLHLEWAFSDEIEKIVTTDLAKNRLDKLRENQHKFNSKAESFLMDAANPTIKETFDLVMLDVPCSATGTIRKYPEVKWNRSRESIHENQKKQLEILAGAAKLVGSNGHLLYMTCSLEPEENQQAVEKFLAENKDKFDLKPFSTKEELQKYLTEEGYYSSLPTENRMGFFAALLNKKS